jgi:hypothetical protein
LENQARVHFRYNECLKARLVTFLRKEVAKKEATEKEDDNDKEDQQA